jgi:hypothetical protein
MPKQLIRIGQDPNDRKGDSLRDAFRKVNDNFAEVYTFSGLDNFINLAQDYAAEMFLNGEHTGVIIEYNDETNKIKFTVATDIDGGTADAVYSTGNFNLDGGAA